MIRPRLGEVKRSLPQLYRWEGESVIKQLLATDLISPLWGKKSRLRNKERERGTGKWIQGNPPTMGAAWAFRWFLGVRVETEGGGGLYYGNGRPQLRIRAFGGGGREGTGLE